MGAHSRYSISDQKAGIRDRILENKLNIRQQTQLDDAETLLFSDAYQYFFDFLWQEKLTFNLALLFRIHKYFLGPLYSWAGKIRTIEISKGGVLFAAAEHINTALREFEPILNTHIPKAQGTKRSTAKDLAIIHCELNAIHPFREGNGRTIRLFLDLLAVSAGYNPIDWSKRSQTEYIQACVDGMAKKYSRMGQVIYSGLTKYG